MIEMKKWEDVKNAMTSLSNEEKQNIEVLSDIVSHMIERRQEIGLSQRDLAQKCGIKQSAIARLEAMKTVPQIDTLSKLMKPLGLKLTVVNDENFAHQH
jgi:ribosome-binding protein aMBF1 (putative translation factor)